MQATVNHIFPNGSSPHFLFEVNKTVDATNKNFYLRDKICVEYVRRKGQSLKTFFFLVQEGFLIYLCIDTCRLAHTIIS